jgi:hypothetical protein
MRCLLPPIPTCIHSRKASTKSPKTPNRGKVVVTSHGFAHVGVTTSLAGTSLASRGTTERLCLSLSRAVSPTLSMNRRQPCLSVCLSTCLSVCQVRGQTVPPTDPCLPERLPPCPACPSARHAMYGMKQPSLEASRWSAHEFKTRKNRCTTRHRHSGQASQLPPGRIVINSHPRKTRAPARTKGAQPSHCPQMPAGSI